MTSTAPEVPSPTVSNRLYAVDGFRTIAAVFVVLIHASSLLVANGEADFWNFHWYRYLIEIAVPFFLITSGYFIATKNLQGVLRYAVDMLALYLSATTFYLVAALAQAILAGVCGAGPGIVDALRGVFSELSLGGFVRGDLLSAHLWYLSAATIATLLIWAARRFQISTPYILGIASSFYLLDLLDVVNLESVVAYGGFPEAFFYMALGMLMFERGVKRWRFTPSLIFITVLLSTGVQSTGGTEFKTLFEIPLAAMLLSLLVTSQSRSTLISRASRYSLSIYILHPFFISLVVMIVSIYSTDASPLSGSILYPLGVACVATTLSIASHYPFSKAVIEPTRKLLSKLSWFLRIAR